MYDHGLLTAGVLQSKEELTDEQAAILKARWRAKTGGMDNAHDVTVLDNSTEFKPLTLSPADAQFLETRKFSTTEIARIFGLPGWIINDQEKSTSWGSGMEQQFIAFVVLSLKPYFHRIEQRVTREVCDPTTEKAEFKVEGLLRGDSKARAAFYASGIQHGWMVPNEPRELEDLPPVPWGDEPYRPYNESARAQGASTDADDTGDDDDDDADA
jgi:HK97 family phage portal protein